MSDEQLEHTPPPAPAGGPEPPGQPTDKVRVRFRKDGSLRLLSHHDLLRTFERLLRRADLPVFATRGFHPHPRIVFALSLPLGVVGLGEVVEVELRETLDPAEVLTRLRAHAPPGLAFLTASRVPTRATARVTGMSYGLVVPADRLGGLADRLSGLLASPACQVERTRPPRRLLDIRPFLRDLRLEPRPGGRAYLSLDLHLTSAGSARPEEVLGALGLADLLGAGVVLERTALQLEDEPQLELASPS